MFQGGAVGVDVPVLLWWRHLERVVHVGVGGGELLELQATEMSVLSETQSQYHLHKEPPRAPPSLPEVPPSALLCAFVVTVTVVSSPILQHLQPLPLFF